MSFIQNDLGATAIEYGLIAALISVVVIGAMTAVGTKLSTTFTAREQRALRSEQLSEGPRARA